MNYKAFDELCTAKYRFTESRLYLTLIVHNLEYMEHINANIIFTDFYTYLVLSKIYGDIPDKGILKQHYFDAVKRISRTSGLSSIKSNDYELYCTFIAEDIQAPSTEESESDPFLLYEEYSTSDMVTHFAISPNSPGRCMQLAETHTVCKVDFRKTTLEGMNAHFYFVIKNSRIEDLNLYLPNVGRQCNLILINSDVKFYNFYNNCFITLVNSSIVTKSANLLLAPTESRTEDLFPIYVISRDQDRKYKDAMYYLEDKEENIKAYYGSKCIKISSSYKVIASDIDRRYGEEDTGVYVRLNKHSSIFHINLNYDVAAYFDGRTCRHLKSATCKQLLDGDVVEIDLSKQYIIYQQSDDHSDYIKPIYL